MSSCNENDRSNSSSSQNEQSVGRNRTPPTWGSNLVGVREGSTPQRPSGDPRTSKRYSNAHDYNASYRQSRLNNPNPASFSSPYHTAQSHNESILNSPPPHIEHGSLVAQDVINEVEQSLQGPMPGSVRRNRQNGYRSDIENVRFSQRSPRNDTQHYESAAYPSCKPPTTGCSYQQPVLQLYSNTPDNYELFEDEEDFEEEPFLPSDVVPKEDLQASLRDLNREMTRSKEVVPAGAGVALTTPRDTPTPRRLNRYGDVAPISYQMPAAENYNSEASRTVNRSAAVVYTPEELAKACMAHQRQMQ